MTKKKRNIQLTSSKTNNVQDPKLDNLLVEAKKVVPGATNEQVLQIVKMVATQYQGPIPPPEMLSQYNDVIKNGAERIFVIFEKQSTHRIDTETKIVKHDIIQSYLGITFAAILSMTVIIGGMILIYNNKEISGFSTLFSGLAALVGTFIYGRIAMNKQAVKK
jgi:uncharacterized membrane protein